LYAKKSKTHIPNLPKTKLDFVTSISSIHIF
jgi:hypothetical protein